MQNAAILSTCIKLTSVVKTFVLSLFEWLFKTGFDICITDKARDTRFGTTVALKKMRMVGEKNGKLFTLCMLGNLSRTFFQKNLS